MNVLSRKICLSSAEDSIASHDLRSWSLGKREPVGRKLPVYLRNA